jgi:long-chain acyl-CoA synthetase
MFEMETLEVYGRPLRVWKNGPKSLTDVFQAAHAFGGLPFMVHQDERINFDAFARAAMAFARLLIARGVQSGERVALAMRNLPEWPVAFYGAALAGAVVTPLNAWWSAGELDYALRDSGAVAGVFDAERYERVRERLAAATAACATFSSVAGQGPQWKAQWISRTPLAVPPPGAIFHPSAACRVR